MRAIGPLRAGGQHGEIGRQRRPRTVLNEAHGEGPARRLRVRAGRLLVLANERPEQALQLLRAAIARVDGLVIFGDPLAQTGG